MSRMRRPFLLIPVVAAPVAAIVLGGLALASPARSSGAGRGEGASAVLRTIAGDEVGRVTFTERDGRVQVRATVQGMPPGHHGFHVHTVGVCDPATAFESARGHINLSGRDHAEHTGDGPSLYVLADGTGRLSYWTDRYRVADLLDGDGSAPIVHAQPDNFSNIPVRYAPAGPDMTTRETGDSGDRIACGVIQAGGEGRPRR